MNQQPNPFAAPDHGVDQNSPMDQSEKAGFRYLGFWKRVLASIIDNVPLAIAFLPYSFALPAVMSNPETADLTYSVISSLLGVIVVILFWQFKQSTPGKMIFNARIVDAETLKKPSVGRYILRYIGYFPSGLVLGLGIIWVAFDKQKRGWHDMMAGTIVIIPADLSDRRGVRRPVKVIQKGKVSED